MYKRNLGGWGWSSRSLLIMPFSSASWQIGRAGKGCHSNPKKFYKDQQELCPLSSRSGIHLRLDHWDRSGIVLVHCSPVTEHILYMGWRSKCHVETVTLQSGSRAPWACLSIPLSPHTLQVTLSTWYLWQGRERLIWKWWALTSLSFVKVRLLPAEIWTAFNQPPLQRGKTN